MGKQHTRAPENCNGVASKEKLGLLHSNLKECKLDENIREVSSYNDHSGDLKEVYQGDNIRCYGIVADEGHYGIRINSISALWHANRLVCFGLSHKIIYGADYFRLRAPRPK